MKAFVIIPFDKAFDDIYKIGIKSTAKDLDVDAYRLDDELFEEGMIEKIYKEIEHADFIIAELSERNANVYYELGYAHALGKQCILVTTSTDNIPFDLKNKRHVEYKGSITTLKEKLTKNIIWAKSEIEEKRKNPFEINLKATGSIEIIDDFQYGAIDFTIDIENRSQRITPEIQAVYIYTESEWNIKQFGKIIPVRKSRSSSEPNAYKYNLATGMQKIPKKGWAQIKIKAEKIMVFPWEEQKEGRGFVINGKFHLEICTDSGNYVFKIPISVPLSSLPF